MLPFFFPQNKLKKIGILFFFIAISFSLLTLNSERQDSIKTKVIYILSPFQHSISRVDRNLANLPKKEFNIEKLREENRKLAEELSNLEIEKNVYKELALENQRLRELLNFQKQLTLNFISAQVIGRDATNWNKVIFINKGSSDGIQKHFPVITPQGLVGQIIETTPHQSKVMTILDANNRIAALVENNRVQGIIRGTNDSWCQFDYISLRDEVKENDAVLSSGQGGVFPKGLLIGKIISVEKEETDLFQKINVTPAVNFSHLEEVIVITGEK